MTLSGDLEKSARSARLSANEAELKALKEDVAKILEYVKELEEYDLSEVEPLYYVHEQCNVLREDIVATPLSREDVLKNAPDTDTVYFRVPLIMEQK